MPTRLRCPGSNRKPKPSAGEPYSRPSRRDTAVTSRHFTGDCRRRPIGGEERPWLASYFSKLENLVEAGHPVIIPIGDAASRGHYLVLVGVKDGNFTALDPSTP